MLLMTLDLPSIDESEEVKEDEGKNNKKEEYGSTCWSLTNW